MKYIIESAPHKKRSRTNYFYLSIGIIIVAILAKWVQYNLLPAKYFFDSGHILNMMRGELDLIWQESYRVTAFFSRTINIWGFDSLLQWSVFYAVAFNPAIIVILRRLKIENLIDHIWIFASAGVLNIYIFNLSKDVLQFAFFLSIYAVISTDASMWKRAILSTSLLFVWGSIFRIYYILIAAYTMMSYLTILYIKKRKSRSFVEWFWILIFGVFLSMMFTMIFMPDEYHVVANIHHRLNFRREGSLNAITMINDVIRNDSGDIFTYIVNYVVNLLRMMFPIELLLKPNIQLSYVLFVAYQLLITVLLILNGKMVFQNNATERSLLAFSVYTGFLLGSALFEPDFGSWIRHQATIFPILTFIFFDVAKPIPAMQSYPISNSRYIRGYRSPA